MLLLVVIIGVDSLDKKKVQYSLRTCFDTLHVLTCYPINDFIADTKKKQDKILKRT